MFGVDKHPNKAQQHRENGNEISESTHAGASGIEQFARVRDYDETPMLHAGRLAGAKHKEEEIHGGERKEARTVDADDPLVGRETFGRLAECGYKEYQINRGDNHEVRRSGRDSRYDQVALIFREREWQRMRRLFEIELRLVFFN